jgi:hypothetical protein
MAKEVVDHNPGTKLVALTDHEITTLHQLLSNESDDLEGKVVEQFATNNDLAVPSSAIIISTLDALATTKVLIGKLLVHMTDCEE